MQVAFSQRRKILRNTLGRWLEAKGFDGEFDLQRRAEEVPVAFVYNGAPFAVICGTDALYATNAAELAKALKGAGASVIHLAGRGADLFDAALADLSSRGIDRPSRIRLDGGMSRNPTFVAMLADAIGTPIEVSKVTEATTLGAAYLAGLAIGTWSDWDDIAAAWNPRTTVDPGRALDRAQWARAVERAAEWIPDLSALDF